MKAKIICAVVAVTIHKATSDALRHELVLFHTVLLLVSPRDASNV